MDANQIIDDTARKLWGMSLDDKIVAYAVEYKKLQSRRIGHVLDALCFLLASFSLVWMFIPVLNRLMVKIADQLVKETRETEKLAEAWREDGVRITRLALARQAQQLINRAKEMK